jgi:fructose-1,6-bisphosphatase-3
MQEQNKQIQGRKYKYLKLLAEKYPTRQAVYAELIHLQAELSLPKGIEHFMSDLHGEYESFFHILNNCSGVIAEKVEYLFENRLTSEEKAEFCTLIYYPKEKIERIEAQRKNTPEWYRTMLTRLLDLSRLLSYKYPAAKVYGFMPERFTSVIIELMNTHPEADKAQSLYHKKLLDTIIQIGSGAEFVEAFTVLIKRLAVDHLHIVGDFFDRGKRPDAIIDMLMQHHSLDIQWGNHDILWMGAACGSEACIAAVIRNSLSYNNMDVLEKGYAISLRPLSLFASKSYPDANPLKASLRAISIIMFKLEGQVIQRNSDFHMESRLLLDKIDYDSCYITINGKRYELGNAYFPTIDPKHPYALTDEEQNIVSELKSFFLESETLRRHVDFLYKKGSIYTCYNQNLLYHGCIPLNEDGSFRDIVFAGQTYAGKSYMDFADRCARKAYCYHDDNSLDFMWYLWCGRQSPLSGREFKTFERTLLDEPETWKEPADAYFHYCNEEVVCEMILKEFGLDPKRGHIINGHVPVKVKAGESPIKANGKAIIIDGGFCRAYQKKTGIAGYTLISNSRGLRLLEHQTFANVREALKANKDIESVSRTVELQNYRTTIGETDEGKEMQERITDLYNLLLTYQNGILVPKE